MTDTDQAAPSTSRLPGAARAAAFREPAADAGSGYAPVAAGVTTAGDRPVRSHPPAVQGGWDRFAGTGVGREGRPVDYGQGWTPPPMREKPAEWGGRRVWVRVLSLGLAKAKPGQEEQEYRANVRLVRQSSWPRCARIVVANPKGGVGKTPTALVLAGKLAQIRGGGVVAWDASAAAGTLAARSETRPGRCITAVVGDPAAFDQPGTIASAVATQSSFADVLGSLQDRAFDDVDIEHALQALDRTYRISIADTGSNEQHGAAFRKVMSRADLLVVPTVVTKDSVDKATGLLSTLQQSGDGIATRAVVAISDHRGPATPGLAAEIEEIFHAHGVGAVVRIPFDPVIAAGTAINVRDLSHASDVAWTRLAAACAHNLIIDPGGI